MSTPALTVVLYTPTDYKAIRRTMRHLRAQTIREQLEIMIVAPAVDRVQLDPGDQESFHSVRVLAVGPTDTLSIARATAIAQATAPVVVLAEDHSFPEPDWASALLAAYCDGWAAVGPIVLNANPRSPVSWANYLASFGRWTDPAAAGPVDYLPGHNTSYKRDVLLACGAELPWFLEVEGFLQDAMREKGHRLYLSGTARTHHVNFSLLRPCLNQMFLGGRLYAEHRFRKQQWSVCKRLLYACAAPLIPLVRLYRIVRNMCRSESQRKLLPRILPALFTGLVAHACGEMAGYTIGAVGVSRRYSDSETLRIRYVTAQDRQKLTSE
jgi:hypothetical protein